MGTHEDIQPAFKEQMVALGRAIDNILNGDKQPPVNGFVLLTFSFEDGIDAERINYLSNARRKEMVTALKEIVARFEGRHIEETQTPMPKEKM